MNQVVQGAAEALGPKWFNGNRLRPPAWTLCVGDVETPFLSGEAP
jgi:hypothetical protein